MAFNWLKKTLGVITPVAMQFVPSQFAGVARTVYAGVVNAESAGGTGQQKLAKALNYATLALPAIVDVIEKITGREVVDQDALKKALEHLASFQVQISKAVGHRPA